MSGRSAGALEGSTTISECVSGCSERSECFARSSTSSLDAFSLMTPLSVDLIVRMLFSALRVVSMATPVSITGFDNETSERHCAFRVKSKKIAMLVA